jgi:uncharacterized membrane protein
LHAARTVMNGDADRHRRKGKTMSILVLGLVLFLGMHSVRIVAEGPRQRFIAQRGEMAWKGLYSLASALGLALLIWGYGQARQQPVVLWASPLWTRHLAALLTLPALILLVAAYVPGNSLKTRLRHPMLLGTKLWAAAHLLANNTLADVLLFGGFLVWAALCFRAARARDAAAGLKAEVGSAALAVLAAVLGTAAWAGLAFWAHALLFGVRPFGG